MAWNRRPWRSARETAEIFWHDTFTDSAGETVTFRLRNEYSTPRLTPDVVRLRRENCHPFFPVARRVRKIRWELPYAREERDPPVRTSQSLATVKEGNIRGRSFRRLLALLLLRPGFTPFEDKLDFDSSSLSCLLWFHQESLSRSMDHK